MSVRAVRLNTPALVRVTEAGKAVQINPNAQGEACSVIIQALGTNEGTIVVGDKNVVAAAGLHAAPTRRGIALAAGQSETIDIVDTSAIWIDATTNGDGVTFMEITA